MAIYFISDLHLTDNQPHLNKLFTHFVHHILQPYDTLYILGDWFEYWIGEDFSSLTQKIIVRLLLSLRERKITWYFLAGNRDFLLNEKTLKKYDGHLLPEYYLMTLNQQKTLLLHGDMLCTDDVKYQAWRKKVHQKWLQKLFLILPLKIRKKIADRMREKSQQQAMELTQTMMDVNKESVLKTFSDFKITLMIHGHVHKPGVHFYWDSLKQEWLTRYVLADWDIMGNFLRYDNDQFELAYF